MRRVIDAKRVCCFEKLSPVSGRAPVIKYLSVNDILSQEGQDGNKRNRGGGTMRTG